MALEVGILGSVQVFKDGQEVVLRAAKQRELLAVLALHAREPVSLDRLCDALWGEDLPGTARKALQVHVSQLRKAGLEIETRPPGYLLCLDDDGLDARRFERVAHEGSDALAAGATQHAAETLREALAQWRGPVLADLSYAEFAQGEIARLEELRLSALEDRIEADLMLGRAELTGELEALVAAHPLRERLRGQLMRALYRAGRQADALETYRAAREALVDELGIEPSPELRELERAILTQDPALAATVAAPRAGGDDFVGREVELTELLALLDDAAAGRGRLVLVAGEAGIGKSRLSDELAARAEARGARVLTGRCWEAGGAPPYWPWVDALREDVRDGPPELRPLTDGAEGARGDPEQDRFRLFDAVGAFLRDAAASRPILLVLDDVHAADAPSLLLLRFLAGRLADTRVLVVAAYRDGEVGPDHPLAPSELVRAPGTALIRLHGLEAAAVERYVCLAAGREVPGTIADGIHAQTEGNPLFVGEIVRLLLAEGRLEDATAALRPGHVPRAVSDVIEHRFDGLSPDCRELLVSASVLGREFAMEAVERLTGAARDEVLDAIDEAVTAHVIEELGARGRLRFTHVLVRDALYCELTPARRARLHRRAGTTLEALYAADDEPHLTELAHHFCSAADASTAERAITYAERAAARAAGQLAYEEAARLYALALEVLERERPGDAAWQCRLLLKLGDAQTRGGDGLGARSHYHRAARIAATAGLVELLAEAAVAPVGRFPWMRLISDPQLVPLLDQALEACGDADHVLRAKLTARMVPALRGELDWEPRLALGERAVAMARRLDDPETLAYVLSARASGLEGPSTLEQTEADAVEIIALGERLGDRERVFSGIEERLLIDWWRGDMAGVARDRAELGRLAGEMRQPAQRWLVLAVDALMAAFEGRLAEAEALGDEALRIGKRAQVWQPSMYHGLKVWALRAEQGRLAELTGALAAWRAENPGHRILDSMEALHLARVGRPDQARDALDAIAAGGFAGVSPDERWLWAAALLAETCALLGAVEHAHALFELLLPHAELVVMAPWEAAPGTTARFAGVLAGMLERWDDSVDLLARAAERDAALGARPAVAHDHHALGEVLLRRAAGDDRRRGQELLERAASEYQELGMAPWAAEALAAV